MTVYIPWYFMMSHIANKHNEQRTVVSPCLIIRLDTHTRLDWVNMLKRLCNIAFMFQLPEIVNNILHNDRSNLK